MTVRSRQLVRLTIAIALTLPVYRSLIASLSTDQDLQQFHFEPVFILGTVSVLTFDVISVVFVDIRNHTARGPH